MNAQITMLPVSEGDSTLILIADGFKNYSVLIDAGLDPNEASSYLQSIGIFHLDLVILSHPDLDHLGGLLTILNGDLMSVGKIWCFDLTFLRDYITNGIIPEPRPSTHEIEYDYILRLTLDKFSDILRTAKSKNIPAFQVSDGYKICVGDILFEVLYPSQRFYNALRDPKALKQLLAEKKSPVKWDVPCDVDEYSNPEIISIESKSDPIKKGNNPGKDMLLTNITEINQDKIEDEKLPWNMIGSLYNNMSIVVKMSMCGGKNGPTALFPGDLCDWTSLIINHGANLRADVLKYPHHGSNLIHYNKSSILSFLKSHSGIYKECFHRTIRGSCFNSYYHLFRLPSDKSSICEIVQPSHILVFPFPRYKLPSLRLNRQWGTMVIANRSNRRFTELSSKDNEKCPAILSFGFDGLTFKRCQNTCQLKAIDNK